MTATGKAGQASGAGSRPELLNVYGFKLGSHPSDYYFAEVIRVRNLNSDDYYYLVNNNIPYRFLSCKSGSTIDIHSSRRPEGCMEVAGDDIPDSKQVVLSQIKGDQLPFNETSNVVKRLRSLLLGRDPRVEVTSIAADGKTAYDVTVPGRTERVAKYHIGPDDFYYGGESCEGAYLVHRDKCYMGMKSVSSSHLADDFDGLREDLKKAVQQQIVRRDEGR